MSGSGQSPLPLVKGEVIMLTLLPLLCLGLIGFGAWLNPHPSGAGTHVQLGLAPCGFLLRTGYPCFACGATTAFSLAVHGRFLDAFWAQPFGALLFFFCLFVIVVCLQALVTKRSLILRVALWPWGSLVVGLVLLILSSWVFKIFTWEMT